jgi:hypothetical protein
MIHIIERYKGNAIEGSIDPHTRWNPEWRVEPQMTGVAGG